MDQFHNRNISTALAFHEATKHSYASVRSGGFSLDWANRPMPYKIYPGAGTLALPRELSLPQMPTLSALEQVSVPREASLDLEVLARLLFCADGLTRRASVDGEVYHFRAAASAGALYPVEIYLAAGEITGMERGLYHFLAADLKLHGLRRGDWRPYLARHAAMSDAIRQARAVLIITSIFWRSGWKYRARAYRYCFWDAGTMLANLLAAANAEPLATELITAFNDGAIEGLLEVDGDREGVACLVALGHCNSEPEESPALESVGLESIPLSQKEVAYEELVAVHRASRLSAEEVHEVANARFEPRQKGDYVTAKTLAAVDTQAGMALGETILRRGSTRIFAQEGLGAQELATILQTSELSVTKDFPAVAETYVIVNAIEGIPAGAYYYNVRSRTLDLLRAGTFRTEAGYLCLEQQLGADCSALIVYMTDLERTLECLGNRGYRTAHLEAGLLGGRAYLAAYSRGRGDTGLTFYDDDTTAFFHPHCGKMSPLLMVAIGVPRSRRSPG